MQIPLAQARQLLEQELDAALLDSALAQARSPTRWRDDQHLHLGPTAVRCRKDRNRWHLEADDGVPPSGVADLGGDLHRHSSAL